MSSKTCTIVLMFPGQGSQYAGMGLNFLNENPGYRKYFKKASDIAGCNLLDIIEDKNGAGTLLDRTQYSQVAIYTLSCAVNDYLFGQNPGRSKLISFAVGHSLGDYAALYSLGAYDFEQGAELVSFRGRIMAEEGSKGITDSGKKMMMAAVIGSDIEIIKDVLESYKDSVFIANINDRTQVVISGYERKLLEAAERIRGLGAKKIIPLKVNIASHCPLMNRVSAKLEGYLKKNFKSFKDLSAGYFSSTEVMQIEPQYISSVLVKQLIKPVRWIESIQMLASKFPPDASSKIFIEMGPGKVLSGLVKRIFATSGREDILIFNTDTPEEMGRINV